MNKSAMLLGVGLFMAACTPLPISSTGNSTSSSTTTSTNTEPVKKPEEVKVDPVYEKYSRNSNSSPLLGVKKLADKPLLESLSSTDVANVYRIKLKNPTPEDLITLTKYYNLQELTLSYGSYTELPKELFKLKNLTSLDITSTRIKSVPFEIANLDQLRSLTLSVNSYYACDIDALKKLTSLKILRLKEGAIQSLPDFGPIQKLQEVHLERTKVKEIPNSITQCKYLRFMYLESNKELKVIPNRLKENSGLEIITERNAIDASQCRELLEQKRIGHLQINPAWGDYSYNKAWKELETYPDQIFHLYFANMPDEDLRRMWQLIPTLTNVTKIDGKLPADMATLSLGQLTNLSSLELDAQGDLTLDISAATRLKKLNVASKHGLTLKTGSTASLEKMEIHTKSFNLSQPMTVAKVSISTSKIPSALANVRMESLTLYIYKDPIVCPSNWAAVKVDTVKLGEIADIKTVPSNFCTNTHIKELNLLAGNEGVSNLNFENIPSNITEMTGLRSLYLPLRSIPAVVYNLTQLEKLVLYHPDGVKKFVIPADIKKLTNLRVFSYTTFVGLGTIEIDPAFYTLPNMEELTLYNCRTSMNVTYFELSEDVGNLKLKKLVLNTPYKVPNSVWSIPTLESLKIYSVKTPVKVSSISLPKLTHFEIENDNASIPFEQMKKLKYLRLNIGKDAPIQNIFGLTNLTEINLYGHELSIRDLNKLKNLETVYTKFCTLKDLSTTSVNLPKLKSFTATSSSLSGMPEFKNEGLEDLDLSYNKGITSLSDSFYDMIELKNIDFSSTAISSISPVFENFTSLSRIEFLKSSLNTEGKKTLMKVKRTRDGLLTSVYY